MPVAEHETDLPSLLERHHLGIGIEAMDEAATGAPPSPPGQPKTTKATIGIIYPPPEVRNIVDKTAAFVARNGPEFESRIKLNEQGNNKFNFLNVGDPYHAYYQHKVKEIQEGRSPVTQASLAAAEVKTTSLQLIDDAKRKKQSELLSKVEQPFVPKAPPAEFEYIGEPPSISAHDLDIVRLTAQFVARNGRQFLSALMNREQRNSQFDFLRPQHSLFQYFTRLLDQYTKVLIPPKDIVQKLAAETPVNTLADVKYRSNWIRHEEMKKKRVEEEAERERMAYSCIDWHDFVVVETVDYQPFEQGQFPPPTNPEEVGARVLLQDRILQGQTPLEGEEGEAPVQDDTEVQDMEEDSSSSDEEETTPEPVTQEKNKSVEPPKEDQVIIRKGYDPKKGPAAPPQPADKRMEAVRPGPRPEEYTISPITGERIPVSKLQEHMRIGLLDPRWRDQRDRQILDRVNQESVYAPGGAIESSLKQLAERRSDIFGVGVEETPIGKKIGEEDRAPGMPWDPSSGTGSSKMGKDRDDDMDDKKDSIGPTMDATSMLKSQGILHSPTTSAPPMPPHMPGVTRTVGQQGIMPPVHQMMMSGMGRVGMPPLLGLPGQGPHQGYSSFNAPPPPGTAHRAPLLPSAPSGMPMMPPMNQMPPPPIHSQQPPPMQPPSLSEDEPVAKKAKTLEDSLIPEDQFLAMNKPTATFMVNVPNAPEKSDGKMSGQLITITLPLKDPVTSLKSRISDSIGLAPGKQKLRLTEGLFFKDSYSLAYYNVSEGSTVYLSLKERGGRKK